MNRKHWNNNNSRLVSRKTNSTVKLNNQSISIKRQISINSLLGTMLPQPYLVLQPLEGNMYLRIC
jgi:hypothetical protein